jgi:hypothetical protein
MDMQSLIESFVTALKDLAIAVTKKQVISAAEALRQWLLQLLGVGETSAA